jgi:PPE-repeat protein
VTNPHFAWLPPEINSARVFAAPGAAPLLAAAEAWDGLAEDLALSASAFLSVTTDLASGSWQGASAAAIMTVATGYVGWLSAAAAQAEAASGQASVIAAAFEAALADTVQPAVVSANRALGQVLATTNWLGQNAPAIADIEAAYEQMWASDVAAMSDYQADTSAAAQQLAPWTLETLGSDSAGRGRVSLDPPSTQGDSSPDGSLGNDFDSGRYITGGSSLTTIGSGLLNSAGVPTGGFNANLHQGLLSPPVKGPGTFG